MQQHEKHIRPLWTHTSLSSYSWPGKTGKTRSTDCVSYPPKITEHVPLCSHIIMSSRRGPRPCTWPLVENPRMITDLSTLQIPQTEVNQGNELSFSILSLLNTSFHLLEYSIDLSVEEARSKALFAS